MKQTKQFVRANKRHMGTRYWTLGKERKEGGLLQMWAMVYVALYLGNCYPAGRKTVIAGGHSEPG